ncbi:MAG: hypothetical protein CMG74_04020 [Candidatus Marinimicrobia bacterium]|nr:hypothetical protein [Candidatus Neomarinimicrobiota bacterium]|tara:strand:+ start:44601 stop:45287 length:687 start_codon:yes stop_codon:yes gene_type:complete
MKTKSIYFIFITLLFGVGFVLAQDEGAVEEANVEEASVEEANVEEAVVEEEAVDDDSVGEEELLEYVEEAPASPLEGFSVGIASTPGFVAGESFSTVPFGGSIVITTPFGFKIGEGLRFTVGMAFGSYSGSYEGEDGVSNSFDPSIIGFGGNLTLAKFVFVEGHAGNIGAGMGLRGFAGVSLERLMKKSLGLPFNILVGGEGFYSSKIADPGNASGWGGVGVRLDYGF